MEVVKDPGSNREQELERMVNQYQSLLLRILLSSLFISYLGVSGFP